MCQYAGDSLCSGTLPKLLSSEFWCHRVVWGRCYSIANIAKISTHRLFPMHTLLTNQRLCLGDSWVPIYLTPVDFEPGHFETAMSHLIREPNINSTVILRADILQDTKYGPDGEVTETHTYSPDLPEADRSSQSEESKQESPETTHRESNANDAPNNGENSAEPAPPLLTRDLSDVSLRTVDLTGASVDLSLSAASIRRIIPRNPYKDHILNQTCLMLQGEGAVLVVYIAHISHVEEVPFYLPPVHAVGLLYHQRQLSIHYVPFAGAGAELRALDDAARPLRIALRLLQTLAKHSHGAQAGYEKRVQHDVVVPKVAFQNRYIALKKKYLGPLVAAWVESTDPKKHVFEDLAVAAFLIELWARRFCGQPFEFRDLGCGNGLLVHILILEGFTGKGIDARARKSWKTYPPEVQANLLEQIIIPSVLLKPHPAVAQMAPHIRDNGRFFSVPEFELRAAPARVPLMKYYSAANLLELSQVCTTEDFPPNTFIIGNHLDELTCWLPLLDFPFMVIPCCLHALNGAKARYSPRKRAPGSAPGLVPKNLSTYAALVDHVEDLASRMGWAVEKEILRIPSTRNAAIIGINKNEPLASELHGQTEMRVIDILATEGGAEGWVENLMALMKKSPKNH